MGKIIKTSLSIQEALFQQAENLAQRLDISVNQLFETAIENFVKSQQDVKTTSKNDGEELVVNQGDIYWVQLEDASGLEPGIPHPHVVIQDNLFNHSRIPTVVACALTSNIKRANIPGNVLLDLGEGSLSKQSVVETSKISAVDKYKLGEYIGSLDEKRVNQILDGMRFLQSSFFNR